MTKAPVPARYDAQRYYDALKRIAAYSPPDRLKRNSEKLYGLPADEAIEMSYENVIQEAKSAIYNKRRPT